MYGVFKMPCEYLFFILLEFAILVLLFLRREEEETRIFLAVLAQQTENMFTFDDSFLYSQTQTYYGR